MVLATPHKFDMICANDATLKLTFAIFPLVTDSSIPLPVVLVCAVIPESNGILLSI